jgi:RNase H-like domain found in reverse transcriptase/Reverse transcriptase (RNA-dependent DNA polymerase)
MGLCNSPDIFQEKISELMQELEYVRAYIDDMLIIITNDSFEDHMKKLQLVLLRLLDEAGLKINATKSFFARSELEYLRYWITRHGIQPTTSKVQAIRNIAIPKNRKELRRLIGMVNYYRDMWIRRSDILAPLTKLTSKNVKWQWKDEHQKAFDTMKKIMSKEVLLAYPDFNEEFVIHTDASHTQLGAVISQKGRPIAFYSRKLKPEQTRDSTTERELLSIVETLKEFRNILLGQKDLVFTDHKNLTYKNFITERVMRWRLILEEYGPELRYVNGEFNIVADALSRLEIISKPTTTNEQMPATEIAEMFAAREEDYPTSFLSATKKLQHGRVTILKFRICSKTSRKRTAKQNMCSVIPHILLSLKKERF